MANEISLTTGFKLANGILVDQVATNTQSINQNTAALVSNTVTVANTESDANLAGLATLGYAILQHVGNTNSNFLQWGPKNANNVMQKLGRLYQGERAVIRLEPGITIRWVANTNAVPVLIRAYND